MINNTLPTRQETCFDNTKLSCYKENPRKYFLRHVLGWSPQSERKPLPLVFGESWHNAMDAVWNANFEDSTNQILERAITNFNQSWQKNGYSVSSRLDEVSEWGARTPGVANEMLFNYIISREKMIKDGKTIATEQPIGMPIPGMTGVWYIGRLDKVVEYNGVHILEHKTTSMYSIAQNFQPMYVESWGTAAQIKGYQVVGSLFYPDLQDVWVDCALVHKKIHDQFKFIPIAHTTPLLLAWLQNTTEWVRRIQKDMDVFMEDGDLRRAFPLSEEAIYGKYGKDSFTDVYEAYPDPSKLQEPPPGFVVDRWDPFDTFNLAQIGKEEKNNA